MFYLFIYNLIFINDLFKFFRDFRLILTPRKGVLHSNFQAYTIDGDGNEKPVAVGSFIVLVFLINTILFSICLLKHNLFENVVYIFDLRLM